MADETLVRLKLSDIPPIARMTDTTKVMLINNGDAYYSTVSALKDGLGINSINNSIDKINSNLNNLVDDCRPIHVDPNNFVEVGFSYYARYGRIVYCHIAAAPNKNINDRCVICELPYSSYHELSPKWLMPINGGHALFSTFIPNATIANGDKSLYVTSPVPGGSEMIMDFCYLTVDPKK